MPLRALRRAAATRLALALVWLLCLSGGEGCAEADAGGDVDAVSAAGHADAIGSGSVPGSVGAGPRRASAASRPSVLLVTLDTVRADHLGAYGHPARPSASFDALAREGLLFERAVAASSRTVPSHASIMTSRYVRAHTVQHGNGNTRLGDEPTLARILSDHGYQTGAFVSNGVLRRRTGLDGGFDVYDDHLPDREANRFVFERCAANTASRALAWLESVEGPFLLWVHLIDPHGPYTPPADFLDRATGSPGAPGAAQDDVELPFLDRQGGHRGIPHYQALPDLHRVGDYRARYLSEIRYADEALGRIVAAARRRAGSDGLVAVVTADHGESIGEGDYYFAHGHGVTPELVHVPMALVAPGVEAARIREPVHHVDVLPTILGRLGIAVPERVAGVDLVERVRSPAGLRDRILFADVGHEVTAYRGELFDRIRYRAAEDPAAGAGEASPVVSERSTHRWSEHAPWPVAPPDPALRAALDAYLAIEGRYVLAEDPTPDFEAQLRALGYLAPE